MKSSDVSIYLPDFKLSATDQEPTEEALISLVNLPYTEAPIVLSPLKEVSLLTIDEIVQNISHKQLENSGILQHVLNDTEDKELVQ